MMITNRIVVKGLVQGIGYRPFVAELAQGLQIGGWVRNTDGIVTIFASGEESAMELFLRGLKNQAPIGARVEELSVKQEEKQNFCEFAIINSDTSNEAGKKEIPLIPADLPVCESCLSELHDKTNRRYRHPFISCTSCGPRYSIIEQLPYDRETISMKRFPMCVSCGREYREPGNRRRHAQTIACRECGPVLSFSKIFPADGEMREEEADKKYSAENGEAAFAAAVRLLGEGGIAAVKDIGGYHLACKPFSDETVRLLRNLKGREKKPFAVLFPDTVSVKEYCLVNEREEELLLSPPRPIVLLKKKACGKQLGSLVCGGSPDIGAMLPCNPLQVMLAEELGPLVMTSANTSGEFLISEDDEMKRWIKRRAFLLQGTDLFGILSHDRPILTPLDDSIVRSICGRTQIFRRARGFVPNPVEVQIGKKIFAAGGDLKACFCYTEKGRAYVSQYLGDLAEEACLLQYRRESGRMRKLFGFAPEVAACDMHPGYFSVQEAKVSAARQEPYRIQHHEAHTASVIAEHRLAAPVLGFAFDGTGYGRDHTIWGSEVFLWDGRKMIRLAHLKPVFLTGADQGARNADTSFYGYLASFQETTKERIYQLKKIVPWFDEKAAELVQRATALGIHTVKSSSMGRLFDAVSAFLDICHYNSYEGEAAIELEHLAAETKRAYPLAIGSASDNGEKYIADTEPLFSGIAEALLNGVPKGEIARGFLYAVSDFICHICKWAEDTFCMSENGEKQYKIRQIVLSGGTFQNGILLERTITRLENEGFLVFINEQVPPGDGGICLGQAYLCASSTDNE